MKPLSGRSSRLYQSAQLLLALAILLLAVPFWVIRLHDRYVSRAAVQCWNRARDSRVEAAFVAEAATVLQPRFPFGCYGPNCPERIWTALLEGTPSDSKSPGYYARSRLMIPGMQRGYECGVVTQPEFRDETNEAAVQLVAIDVGACARSLEGQRALACQIGAVTRMHDVVPTALWDDDEGDHSWRQGSESGEFLTVVKAVFSIHPIQASLAAILMTLPLLMFAVVRWLRWVLGESVTTPPSTQTGGP